MVRVFVYVLIVFALAAGFAWLADRPGDLQLDWQGYHIETSLLVAAIAIAFAVAILALIVALFRAIVSTPRTLGNYLGARRRDRGYKALSRGMIAVGAGDVRTARRAADESSSLLGEEPLTLLLSAQAAQLSGDGDRARQAFESLAGQSDTRVLGLHGLFVEARRQGEHEAARHFAEEAAQVAPKIGWAGEALFAYQAQAGDWLGALRTLGANTSAKLVDKKTSRRWRAVLLTALAEEIESSNPVEARAHALEAHRLAPDLSEAAVVAGRLLARSGDYRRASRTLEAAWKIAPHPDLADSYAAVRSGDSVRDRLKRMRRLFELRAHHPEGAMAVARAAIDAHDWQAARDVLEGLSRARPSERVCLLMAEIEDGEHGDEGRVRAWLARAINAPRDPIWVADGKVFSHWEPVSPVSGRIDAFEWKVAGEPLAGARMPQIDVERGPRAPVSIEPGEIEAKPESPSEIIEIAHVRSPTPVDTAEPVADTSDASDTNESGTLEEGPEAKPDEPTIIETVTEAGPISTEETGSDPAEDLPPEVPHVPDDPGPEPLEDDDAPKRFNLFRPSA